MVFKRNLFCKYLKFLPRNNRSQNGTINYVFMRTTDIYKVNSLFLINFNIKVKVFMPHT